MKKNTLIAIVISMIALFVFSSCGLKTADISEGSSDFSPPSYGDIPFRERLFIGEGEMISTGGGDELVWFYRVFGGHNYNGVPDYLVDIVGYEAYMEWSYQFQPNNPGATRNFRELDMTAYIEEFGISMEEIIKTTEQHFGMSMAEIDARVTWSRSIDLLAASEQEEDIASLWMHFMSLGDIEAIFSKDVQKLWDAFPSLGVIQDGKVYSPEWILVNVDKAINQEQLPLEDIDRIIYYAHYHSALDEITHRAEAIFQEELKARRGIADAQGDDEDGDEDNQGEGNEDGDQDGDDGKGKGNNENGNQDEDGNQGGNGNRKRPGNEQ